MTRLVAAGSARTAEVAGPGEVAGTAAGRAGAELQATAQRPASKAAARTMRVLCVPGLTLTRSRMPVHREESMNGMMNAACTWLLGARRRGGVCPAAHSNENELTGLGG